MAVDSLVIIFGSVVGILHESNFLLKPKNISKIPIYKKNEIKIDKEATEKDYTHF